MSVEPGDAQTAPVQLGEVQAVALEAARRYRASLVVDPFQAVHLAQGLRAAGVRVREFTFSSGSVGRLALTMLRLLRDQLLDLPDDEALIDELSAVRLVEAQPGNYRIDHDSQGHDDRVISLALSAQALVEKGPQRASIHTSVDRRLGGRVTSSGRGSAQQGADIRIGGFRIPPHLRDYYRPPGQR